MGLPLYLAMTAGEMNKAETLPERFAYMACHFSPYGTGLSNFPEVLPPQSILMVNDRTPVMGHDPILIARQLQQAAEALQPEAVILDLQRPGQALSGQIAAQVCRELRVPVAVSECYARELDCPVFANAVPLTKKIEDHLKPWHGRQIFLEAALDSMLYCVTQAGCSICPASLPDDPENCHAGHGFFCQYKTKLLQDRAEFTLYRTLQQLDALLDKAEQLGVSAAVGLYQEFGKKEKPLK